VIIIHKEFFDRVLENLRSRLGDLCLQFCKGLLEFEALGWGTVVKPFGHGSQHKTQTLGKGSSIKFAKLKDKKIASDKIDKREALETPPTTNLHRTQ
jgi:hypothetical protein